MNTNSTGYDVIGDIHGQSEKLFALLRRMGYTPRGKTWSPPQGRKAVFLGDLIDRGPGQREVLNAVRSMVDDGNALCIMGNHEFNAIGYVTPVKEGADTFLRKHSKTNMDQHKEFLAQIGEGSDLHQDTVNWFRTLPPFLDLGGIRVVHAWWNQAYVDLISAERLSNPKFEGGWLHRAFDKSLPEGRAMEGLTKGLEIPLPDPHYFEDHAGVRRKEVRTKWWMTDAKHYREVAIVQEDQRHRVPDIPLTPDFQPEHITGSPIFVGHYWMTGTPALQTQKVACLDYSAAKSGPLVGYRWNGETELTPDGYVLSHP